MLVVICVGIRADAPLCTITNCLQMPYWKNGQPFHCCQLNYQSATTGRSPAVDIARRPSTCGRASAPQLMHRACGNLKMPYWKKNNTYRHVVTVHDGASAPLSECKHGQVARCRDSPADVHMRRGLLAPFPRRRRRLAGSLQATRIGKATESVFWGIGTESQLHYVMAFADISDL